MINIILSYMVSYNLYHFNSSNFLVSLLHMQWVSLSVKVWEIDPGLLLNVCFCLKKASRPHINFAWMFEELNSWINSRCYNGNEFWITWVSLKFLLLKVDFLVSNGITVSKILLKVQVETIMLCTTSLLISSLIISFSCFPGR